MDKSMGILLMVIFGISGVGVTALAWLFPSLHLDKTEATLAGLIGIGFLVFQSIRFKHSSHDNPDAASFDVQAEDKA